MAKDRSTRKPGEDAARETEHGGEFAGGDQSGHGPSGWPDMQGEGNRDAAREYNESQREFVQSGDVERAAHEAEPTSDAERAEMERAEREGRSHARK